jgi:hypothetical protein
MVSLGARFNQNGSLQVWLLLTLGVVCISGFGLWGVMRHWRFVVETQLRLNQCVGTTAQEFRSSLNKIDASNLRIKALRVSMGAAQAQPALAPPIQAALQLEVIHQNSLLALWKVRAVRWLAERGCRKSGDWGWPLPTLNYFRTPPDALGPQELQWRGVMPEEFQFQARHSPRFSAAVVRKESHAFQVQSSWKAFWSSPSLLSGTGFH